MRIISRRWALAAIIPVAMAAGGWIGITYAVSDPPSTIILCVDQVIVRTADDSGACRDKEEQIEVYTKSGTDAAILAAAAGTNADTLDNLDSTAFVQVGDPIDAATLDGLDSSAFVQVGDAIDAATLDGLDSTAFAAASHNHDSSYYTKAQADAAFLGIGATAADASKLGGFAAEQYALVGTLTTDLNATMAAGSCVIVEIPVLYEAGTPVLFNYAPFLPVGVFVRGTRVQVDDVLQVELCNITAAPVTLTNVPAEFKTFE